MASGRMAPSNAKSGRNVDPTLRPDSRLAFRCLVRQTHGTHGTHGTQGIIFADVAASPVSPKPSTVNHTTTRRSKYARRWFPAVIQVAPQEAVTLTALIYPVNSFWSVGRPQLIPCCGSVPIDLTLLGSTQLHSRIVLSRRTNAGAAGGC